MLDVEDERSCLIQASRFRYSDVPEDVIYFLSEKPSILRLLRSGSFHGDGIDHQEKGFLRHLRTWNTCTRPAGQLRLQWQTTCSGVYKGTFAIGTTKTHSAIIRFGRLKSHDHSHGHGSLEIFADGNLFESHAVTLKGHYHGKGVRTRGMRLSRDVSRMVPQGEQSANQIFTQERSQPHPLRP